MAPKVLIRATQFETGEQSVKKILVIAEVVDIQHWLVGQLERMGFIVASATAVEEGVKVALAQRPDLILMDVLLPRIDGLKATRMLRALKETNRTPILIVSPFFQGADVQTCVEAGCAQYIVKPFTLSELYSKIRELLYPARGTTR